MTIYLIHKNPPEFPEHFLVKRLNVRSWGYYPSRISTVARTLEEARAELPDMEHLMRVPVHSSDDKSLVEAWQ